MFTSLTPISELILGLKLTKPMVLDQLHLHVSLWEHEPTTDTVTYTKDFCFCPPVISHWNTRSLSCQLELCYLIIWQKKLLCYSFFCSLLDLLPQNLKVELRNQNLLMPYAFLMSEIRLSDTFIWAKKFRAGGNQLELTAGYLCWAEGGKKNCPTVKTVTENPPSNTALLQFHK